MAPQPPRRVARALLSVSDKTGLVELARGLAALGVGAGVVVGGGFGLDEELLLEVRQLSVCVLAIERNHVGQAARADRCRCAGEVSV